MSNKPLLYTLTLLSLLCLQACNSSQGLGSNDKKVKIIEMKKGPCFGRCAVFTLSIYDNGTATYEGERFTNRLGLHTKQLGNAAFKELVTEFKNVNFWQFKAVYKGQIPDMQTVTITYIENDQTKSVMGKDGRPEEIVRLEGLLDEIANSSGWIQEGNKHSDLPSNVIANELIVQLVNSVDVQIWVRNYAKQNMEIVKPLSPNGFFWLVSFDDSAIPPKQMLEFVQEDPNVISAEFNKTVNRR